MNFLARGIRAASSGEIKRAGKGQKALATSEKIVALNEKGIKGEIGNGCAVCSATIRYG